MECVNKEIKRLKNAETVYIYGAGDVAREVAYCLMDSPYQISIEAFLVSDIKAVEGEMVLGKPVISYMEIKDKQTAVVIIAVLEKYRDAVVKNLKSIGVNNHSYITFESDLWCEIRGEYLRSKSNDKSIKEYMWLEDELDLSFASNISNNELKVYVAKSHVDKELCEQFENRKWEEISRKAIMK